MMLISLTLGWLDRWKLALGDELQLWPKPIGANQTRGTQDLERKHDRWNHGLVSKLPVRRLLTIGQQGPELEDKTILSGDNMRFSFLLINGPRIYDVLKLQSKMVSLGARCANPRAPHQKIPPQSNSAEGSPSSTSTGRPSPSSAPTCSTRWPVTWLSSWS